MAMSKPDDSTDDPRPVLPRPWQLVCRPNFGRSGPYDDPDDLRSHWTAVADWLNHQVPGQCDSPAVPVMQAGGLSPADWYRQALTRP
jgi:hypothetical protein